MGTWQIHGLLVSLRSVKQYLLLSRVNPKMLSFPEVYLFIHPSVIVVTSILPSKEDSQRDSF